MQPLHSSFRHAHTPPHDPCHVASSCCFLSEMFGPLKLSRPFSRLPRWTIAAKLQDTGCEPPQMHLAFSFIRHRELERYHLKLDIRTTQCLGLCIKVSCVETVLIINSLTDLTNHCSAAGQKHLIASTWRERERDSLRPFSQQWPMRTNLCQCVGLYYLYTDGQNESRDSLLVFMPH